MISTLVIGIGVVAALWLLFRFLGSNYFGRGKSRTDFGHGVRSLLLMMEQGGILRIRCQESEIHFDFVRVSESDRSADLVLSVPRAKWSEAIQPELERVFEANEFEASFSSAPTDGALGEVRVHVADIWDEACGARAARAAHLLVDAMSIAHDSKFDLSLIGPRSNRITSNSRKQRRTR